MGPFKDYILRAIEDLKFKDFTEVQKAVWDRFNSEKNILVQSKTGSGKTHAFLIPIFQNLEENVNIIQAVIVAPTKELSFQIYKMVQHIASFSSNPIDIRLYSGGTDRMKEIERLKVSNPQIVIGTPGKLKDLCIEENVLKLYTAKYFVVDEADMAFETGFQEELDQIAAIVTNAKFMFFSATISNQILPFIKKYMTNVEYIHLEELSASIQHIWIPLKHKDRIDVLLSLLNCFQPYFCIVFTNKKEQCIRLTEILSSKGYNVGMLHGDLNIRERKHILQDCKMLKYQYLVATDLASRGIDIEGVSHIINYELPKDFEFYIHRSGRTGRMYKDGIVYSLYDELDNAYLDSLNQKGIRPNYFEIKNGELIEFKGRNTRSQRVKPKMDYYTEAAKFVPKEKKVSPGYKKKRKAKIEDIAKRLKKNEQKKKKHRSGK